MTRATRSPSSPRSSAGPGGQICVSLAERRPADCLEKLEHLRFAEIRLDVMEASCEDVRRIFSCNKTLIATQRPNSRAAPERLRLMETAIEAGASYIDIELDSDADYRKKLVELARLHDCQVIISHHDYQGTPEPAVLHELVRRCLEAGADIVKIACTVRRKQDGARLIGLLDSEVPLVVVGMGAVGRITRLAGPLLGGLFGYASLENGYETAPGQIDRRTLQDLMEACNGA